MRAMRGAPGRLWRSRDLVWTFVARDLGARLRGTALGPLWPLIHPLALFAAYGFVFSTLLGIRMPGTAAELGHAYGVYLFTGTLVWAAFSEATSRAATSIVDHRHLVQRTAFPGEVLPFEIVLSTTVTQLIAVLAFVLACVLTPLWPAPGASLVWLPAILVLQVTFTSGLALGLAALHVVRRDVAQIWSVVLTFFMFATPLFWVASSDVLPGIETWLPWIEWNPLHHLLRAWRAVLMGGAPVGLFTESPAPALLAFAPFAVAALVAGLGLFCGLERRFTDET
ncbi:MAG: ABC transporter permease [bacterium]|nr:ABC transporter permease [bacterium]